MHLPLAKYFFCLPLGVKPPEDNTGVMKVVGLKPHSNDQSNDRINLLVRISPEISDEEINEVFLATAYKEEQEQRSACKVEFVYEMDYPILVHAYKHSKTIWATDLSSNEPSLKINLGAYEFLCFVQCGIQSDG